MKREKGETEVDKNNQQSTITVINVNVELTEMLQDIIQQMETQEESIKVVEPDPKSDERNSRTIQGNILLFSYGLPKASTSRVLVLTTKLFLQVIAKMTEKTDYARLVHQAYHFALMR